MSDCTDASRSERAEEYVLGRMADSERDEFERHWFGCDRCFEQVRLCQALQEQTRGRRALPGAARRFRALAPVAAAVLVAVIGLAILNANRRSVPRPAEAPPRPAVEAPIAAEPAAAAHPADALSAELTRLAELRPARYTPVVLRDGGSEARQAFRAAMEDYRAGRFEAARKPLERALRMDPGAPDIAFFLGVTELLSGNEPAGIAALERAVALGDTPWLEESLVYLGEARVRRGEHAAARSALQRVVALDGEFAPHARRLLAALPPGRSD